MSASEKVLLPSDWMDQWRNAYTRIDQAGYGEAVSSAYRDSGPQIAAVAGADFALRLGRMVSDAAIRCDRRAAAILCGSALEAAQRLSGPNEMAQWMQAIESVITAAPKAVAALLENTNALLSRLDMEGFLTFVRMGIAVGRRSAERQLAFFRLVDLEARQFLEHTSASNGFHAFEGRLKLYLSAVWGISPPIRETPPGAPENMRRRTGFGGGGIRLPPSFPGFTGHDTLALYRAAIAHVGAHHRYTTRLFPVGSLKSLQLAVISLIEDARVERLATRDMPGLNRLWRSFHVAKAGGAPVAITLMARLSRALADPTYVDTDGWVEKGRALFEAAAQDDLTDQSLSRRIGGLLGNDLGQMRLQFDAITYVVQPAYRDDNLGIWDPGEQTPEVTIEMDEMTSGARIEREETDDGKPDDRDMQSDPDQRFSRASISIADDAASVVAHYHEYDYVVGKTRPDWCTLRELQTPIGDAQPIRRFEEQRDDIVDRLSSLVRSAKISRAERLRRQAEGEYLDMDACIEASISSRVGEVPDFRVYGRSERRSHDLSVLVLLDVSQSTADRIHNKGETVLDLERLSVALLAGALSAADDPFAIAAFCSDTREDVRYFRIKDFDTAYDAFARSRLAGIQSGLSTRLGTAIRHAGVDLSRCQTHRRLLLVVTDGEPSDVDVDDSRYLVEDARTAVHSLNRSGIDTFCVVLDSDVRSYADRIFGRRGTAALASVEQLPMQLPAIFYRLTR